MLHLRWMALLILITLASTSQAASLASFCTLDKSGKIEGEKIDLRLPIASVSKVVTAWWSLAEAGMNYRFPTELKLTPVAAGVYDLHIKGSRDPYFGRESLHFAISELNRRGIKRIRLFTFDENFKFYVDVTSSDRATGHYITSSPQPSTVEAQLRSLNPLTEGWSTTQKLAKISKFEIIESPSFKVDEFSHIPASEYHEGAQTQTLTMRSSPLATLLKEMNRNSNNHAANQIFEHFGGASAFGPFAQSRLEISEENIRMLNGSGDRVDLESGDAAYNEASCSAILKILKDMRMSLQKEGKDLQQIMAVAGGDATSTVSRVYRNDHTSNSLIAKTGTVNPAITLAGLVHTKDGEIYFMYNYATKGSASDWRSARSKIREKVTELVRKHNGGKPIKYSSFQFTSIDASSLFEGDFVEPDGLDSYVYDIPYKKPRPRPAHLLKVPTAP